MPIPVVAAALAMAHAAGLAACAPATQQVVRPAVEAGVEEATERDVAKEVERLLSAPEMRESLQYLGEALLGGARQDLAGPEWEAVVRARSADLVEGMAPALARSLETDVGPALRRELALAVEGAMRELAAPGAQAQLQDVTRAVTTAMTESLLATPGSVGHYGTNGYGTNGYGTNGHAAGGADAGRPPLRRATEDLMLGVGDALQGELGDAIHVFLRRERAALYEEIGWATEPLRVVLDVLIVALVPTAFVLGVFAWRTVRAARRHDRAARLLAGADPAALDALLARVERDGDVDLARYLRRLAGRS